MVKLTNEERDLLNELRKKRPALTYKKTVDKRKGEGRTTGQVVSDAQPDALTHGVTGKCK